MEKRLKLKKFKLKSKNPNTPKDKKLDFNIWYDKKRALIVKIAYKRLGDWEYRLKKLISDFFIKIISAYPSIFESWTSNQSPQIPILMTYSNKILHLKI